MRLIDADVMIKKICGEKCGCTRKECGDDICEPVAMVYEVPTAYDLDKVVEQLEEMDIGDKWVNCHIIIQRAIEVIKAGGIDD